MVNIVSRIIALISIIMGINLFYLKYHVVNLEEDRKRINKVIAQEKDSINLLKAEWVHLSDPTRIQKLANDMKLVPIRPKAGININTIPMRNLIQEKVS